MSSDHCAARCCQIISTKGMSAANIKLLKTETGIMRQLAHPHIVKLHEVYESSNAVSL